MRDRNYLKINENSMLVHSNVCPEEEGIEAGRARRQVACRLRVRAAPRRSRRVGAVPARMRTPKPAPRDRGRRARGRKRAAGRVAGLHPGDAGADLPEAMVRRRRFPFPRSAPPDPGSGRSGPDVRDLGVIDSAPSGGRSRARPGNGTRKG